jgi:hypothetical protein
MAGGPVRHPYAGVDFIPQSGIYEFGYRPHPVGQQLMSGAYYLGYSGSLRMISLGLPLTSYRAKNNIFHKNVYESLKSITKSSKL